MLILSVFNTQEHEYVPPYKFQTAIASWQWAQLPDKTGNVSKESIHLNIADTVLIMYRK